jgi:biopolymer transport protein ExbB
MSGKLCIGRFAPAVIAACGYLFVAGVCAQEAVADPSVVSSNPKNAPDTVPAIEVDYSLKAVVAGLQADSKTSADKLVAREAQFQQRLGASKTRLAESQATLKQREDEGHRLEQRFDENKVALNDKAKLLTDKIGALKELFGVFQQNASDLIGAFVGSPTSLQYPDRDKWLEGFANRMKNASEVSSADDIKTLWFEVQREIVAAGDIVRLRAPVLAADGSRSERDIVRVGTFNLVSVDPDPAYLVWKAGKQEVAELKRQPAGPYLQEITGFVEGQSGLHTFSLDPTGGVLLSLLIEKPNLRERVDQGGLVGYMILGLGMIALVLALLKLLDISIISVRVALQRRNLSTPRASNSLGRLLNTYQQNQHVDSETLEMRLHERVQKENSRVHRFTVFLAIIAAVAPLMGLLGTVVGMINTFQAITLYGTGDPQTMAGGISQALITTVLGLVVAVPAVLLHAMVSGRGKSVVNVLKQQSAALTGDRLQAQNAVSA